MPPKVPLIQGPTPLHRLDHLSRELGIDLWIKRDDLTGFGLGGNKGRKLEYLMADALAQEAEVVVSCGSTQSNFVRQLGAACSVFGMKCAAAVMEIPRSDYNPLPVGPGLHGVGGNVLIDEMLGAELRRFPNGTWDELYAEMEAVACEYEAAGKKVYRCPIGGSTPLGAYAFVQAGREIMLQSDPFDWIVTASSSGSTHTGLQACFKGTSTKVLGMASDPEPDLVDDYADLSAQLDPLLEEPANLRPEDFLLNLDFVGEGYGVPSPAGNAAILRMARTEGIFLDPIYSGKAFAGLLSLAEVGELKGRVLFWHTGGIPTLFAME